MTSGGFDGRQKEPQYYAVVPESTRELDASALENLAEVSGRGSTLTFSASCDDLLRIEAGDTIVAGSTDFTPVLPLNVGIAGKCPPI